MQVKFLVHNPHTAPNAHKAVVKGVEMVASVDTFEVELKAQDESHGGLKLRFVGDDAKAAQELFKNDREVVATFAAADAPAEAAPAAA
jgi:hypothetical protein